MFGDDTIFEDIAEELLQVYDLEDLLEINNITPHEALTILLEGGHIGYPRNIVGRLQIEEGDDS